MTFLTVSALSNDANVSLNKVDFQGCVKLPMFQKVLMASINRTGKAFNVFKRFSCFLIFPGLPKAANVSQKKLIMGIITAGSTGANSLDIYLIPLPLYHRSALILGLATVIIYGECSVHDLC